MKSIFGPLLVCLCGAINGASPSPKFLTGPVELEGANLGANFVGHDIASIFNATKQSPYLRTKMEFETTIASDARRARFISEPIFAKLHSTDALAFVVAKADVFTYDADLQTMRAHLTNRQNHFRDDSDEPVDTIPIREVVLKRDKYIAGNAFGAKVVVDRTYEQEFGVAFSHSPWTFRDLVIPMNVADARATKADLKLVFVCRLSVPYFHSTVDDDYATITEPYQTIVEKNYVHVVPLQVLAINSRTGQVLGEIIEPPIPVIPPSSATLRTSHDGFKPTPKSIVVDSAIQASKILRQVKAPYPPLARQARIVGSVRFEAVIGSDGRIQNLHLISGHPLLVAAATQAVEQWVYSPTLINGNPVDVKTTIHVDFDLNQ